MGRYINWDDVVIRYPSIDNIGGAAEVGSAWIGAVEAQLDGMLSPQFSVPFSSNNETIKDLAIELAYTRMGNLKVDESKDMREMFMERINRLKTGMESMITSSGDLVGLVGDTVYSSTQNFNPVFELDAVTEWEIDSSQLDSIESGKL